MRVGVAIEETWDFFNEIYADLSENHMTVLFEQRSTRSPIFYERLNRRRFVNDMQDFLRSNDVVFFEWASRLLAAASNLPKSCAIISRLHRYEMYQWVDQINWDIVDKLILVSKAKQNEFSMRFPQYAEKTVVIPEAVSLSDFQFSDKPYRGDLGILCHLTPRKRVYDLLMTFYEISKHTSEFHLHIGGGHNPAFGDHYFALHDMTKKLGLKDKVTFYGHVTDTQSWYRNIDIFISNSESEGLQVSPMEAMACGCYCISHNWDGADELLPPQNLYYSGTELQELIFRFSTLSESQKRFERERMRAIVSDNFDVNQIKSRVRKVIEEAGTTQPC